MAASTQEKLYQLFQVGKSCEEIQRLNVGSFSLGAIVRARMEHRWDERLEEHRLQLLQQSREKVQQVQLETIDRLLNELAASNKLTNDKVLRFLQTGDEAELAGTSVGSIKHLTEVVRMVMALTGQDAKKQQTQVGGVVEHRHSVASTPVIELPVPPAGKPLPAETAAEALKIIHRNRQGGDK
jgi:hypothetical protein